MAKLNKANIEFLPAALEIQAAPAPKWARSIVWTLVILLVVTITWLCWGRIDIVASAQGKLVPQQQVQVIQPIETGAVLAVHVKEGSEVVEGQILLELDPAITQADKQDLTAQLNHVNAQVERLRELLLFAQQVIDNDEGKIRFVTPKSVHNDTEHNLLLSQIKEFEQSRQAAWSAIVSLEAQLMGAQLSVKKIQTMLPLIEERTQSLKVLENEKLVAREQYLSLKQEALDLAGQLPIEQATVRELKSQISQAKAQYALLLTDLRKQSLIELNDALSRQTTLKQQLAKSTFLEGKTRLVAPVSGTVEALSVTTIGQIVTPAQELMRIVPMNDMLVVDAGLLNKDIGFVFIGQEVEVKIESFPFTRYGVIEGKVIDVSMDAMEHEVHGLVFPIKVAIEKQSMLIDDRIVALSSGMTVTAEVKTGYRRIIEFLLSPIIQSVNEGARER
ncbi:HlyD family type I secretion periplasmic adaptor subunit [Pseudoalteromonas luteoviolacea]|uniref:Membrane fusion protein (MFP) family protein n=1 Tax=Pseudoalteromonas luteoviolacea S4054 TaxID=1129367 RepID=A0A0F6A500_9GAMM|nr:HlyD family type I secretion periplasmic adaptor subunit [Pseudoalteromonas luteoviolacea]AOT08178.1 hypothetical protein S4054249_10130 [Pseudoalteromonas luteoviolacea]AOT13095.1 hypothetical protein S40542_10130 [Pseudoalteromonas luteoviolacea]AOT18007.1 hypothetical protein S4054_10125 [Pseudoalteromonas luteoviolacea]KKE81163.1 hypothetical protein N479_23640 [Pseudoalteromonas luteoviolacea S4054]KZN65802.1 hypothetical protein N481_24985 [Pseudoalteromonas luteoviolacea S4047-1]